MGNPVVHFEIHTRDNEESAKFYSELFGWHTQTMPMGEEGNYIVVDTHAKLGINGGIASSAGDPHTIFYIEVDSPKGTLPKLEKAGAKTVMPEVEIPGVVTFAQFSDPAGNLIGLVKAGDGPGVSAGNNAPVAWFEIMTAKPEELSKFYTKNFGWTGKKSDIPGDFVYMEHDTQSGDRGVGGGIGSSPDGSDAVLMYAGVDDIAKYIERAESQGAKTVMGPQEISPGFTVAAFTDPQGVLFGMFQGMP